MVYSSVQSCIGHSVLFLSECNCYKVCRLHVYKCGLAILLIFATAIMCVI